MSVIYAKFRHIGSLIQPTTRDAAKLSHSVTENKLSLHQPTDILSPHSSFVRELNDECIMHVTVAVAPYILAYPLHAYNMGSRSNHARERPLMRNTCVLGWPS